MKIETTDIQAAIEKAQSIIRDDKQMSAGTKSIVEILILVVTLLANRLNLNSTNSSRIGSDRFWLYCISNSA